MKLTKNKLFSGILLFGLTTILLVLFDIQQFYLRAIFSFIFLTTIPGLLIMLMFKIRKIEFWEYFTYTIGLSISFLMFGGLAINWVLPWLHITDKPLSLMPLLTSFYIILSVFWFIAYKRNKNISLKIKYPKLGWLNKVFFITPIIFPILSILGAISLNNGGTNLFTMTMMGGVALYVFLLIVLRKKINSNIFPYSIILISIAALLMVSLRSWHISGWDINQEYFTFLQTMKNQKWDISVFRNAYNACLSITILPTIFATLTNISNEYVYKIFFQLIFGFTSVAVFTVFKRYSNPAMAFIGSFFFISQSSYINEVTALNRQEIGLFFFSLILLSMFNNKLSMLNKKLLVIIFGFSLVVSHYSTNLIAIFLILFSFITIGFLKITVKNFKHKSLKSFLHKNLKIHFSTGISYLIIIILMSFTLYWYSIQTGIFSNFVSFGVNAVKNSSEIFNSGLGSNQTLSIILGTLRKNDQQLSNDYLNTKLSQVDMSKQNFMRYGFDIVPQPAEYYPVTHESLYTIFMYIKNIVKIFTLISIIIGMFVIIDSKKSEYNKIHIEYKFLAIFSIVLIGFTILIPYINREYGIERLYQQVLMILGLPAIIGSVYIVSFFKKRSHLLSFIVLFYIVYFLIYYSFITQITGGQFGGGQLRNLNNFGNDYNLFYTFDQEVKAANWISTLPKNSMIYADHIAGLRLISFSDILLNKKYNDTILPGFIPRNAYVFQDVMNTYKQIGFIYIDTHVVNYKYPSQYLSNNKNLIYSTGGTNIYR